MGSDIWTSRRATMVREQIRRRNVTDERVLDAMERVPRELFVPPSLRHLACTDHALAIGHGQTISQPFMVAAMTEALGLQPGERVLEIGTGSGYQAAVLSTLGAEVWSIERLGILAERARALLDEVGCGDVRVRVADGSLGWPEAAPFDAIVVTAASPTVPDRLLQQLRPEGGRLLAPVGDKELQDLVRVERDGTEWVTERLMSCRFVPLLGEDGWPVAD